MYTNVKVNNLKCEYSVDPLGLEVLRPRLSWHIESDCRGQLQKAYQVLVSTSVSRLEAGDGDLWDSGKVDSDNSIQVEYDGTALQSRQRCFWKVRIWDKDNQPSQYSNAASWEMGLLKKLDWKANWIEPYYKVPDHEAGPCPMLRKEFNIPSVFTYGRAYITALGLYELYINGQRVGSRFLSPEWTDYSKRVQYQTYDVTGILKKGTNAVGIILAEGWYAGRVGYYEQRRHYGYRPRVLLQLEADGIIVTCSDDSWKQTLDGPLCSSSILDGEYYDANKEMPGWNKPGFDDSKWETAACLDWSKTKVVSQYNEPIAVTQTIQAKSASSPEEGIFIYDMGQNFAGWSQLKLKGRKGQQVKARHAEALNPDGTLYTDNLRVDCYVGPPKGTLPGAGQTDIFILNGNEEGEICEPHFTYHGFRYIEITGIDKPLPLESVIGKVVHSSAPLVSKFHCSDDMINKLMSNIQWTLRSNLHSVPTDCPQRDERLGWMGDAQVFSQTACYLMDMSRFFNKWIYDIRDAQWENGFYTDFCPMVEKERCSGAPGWADAGLIIPWRLYENYHDTRVLQEHFDSAKKYIDCVHLANPDLIWRNETGKPFSDWLNGDSFIMDDWPKGNAAIPEEVFNTAYFAHSTFLLSKMADIIGKDEESRRYLELFNDIKRAFNTEFVDSEGKIKGNTQAGYAIALHFDLIDRELCQAAAGHMVKSIEDYNWHISTGLICTHMLMLELSRYGYNDIACKLLKNETFPSWFYSVINGATTIWERWDGYVKGRGFQDPSMNSFNHYALGAVGQWIFENITGLKLDAEMPAYKHFILHPRFDGDIKHACCEYESAYGTIKFAWKIEQTDLRFEITVPPNTEATLYLPAENIDKVTEAGNKIDSVSGIKCIETGQKITFCRLLSGKYDFLVSEFE